MCHNLSSLLVFCQNVSTLPENFHFQTVVFENSPNIDLANFSQNISTVIFLNEIPSCYIRSKLQAEFQITSIPNCIYKLPEILPDFQNQNPIILLFLFLFLLLLYLLSAIHMIIKVSINSVNFSFQLKSFLL